MSQPHRLASGGLIERDAPLSFRFDGRNFAAFRGDTLASALLANGVRLVGRSFKYHRPRGFLSAGSEEPNGLVELNSCARRTPNSKATAVELYGGLEATSQNRWPSLRFDIASLNSVLAPLLGAGFYYKTFMWPASFWEKLYEPAIRRAAGLGRAASAADPDHYEKAFAHCDVLVVGSGPAGLMAALSAGRTGARVILAEEDFRLGGRLLCERYEIDGRPAALWVREMEAELASLPDVTILPRTAVFGVYDNRSYGALECVTDHRADATAGLPRQRLWKIIARHTVLASGATERPVVFGGNDRPGVMLAASIRTYLNRFAAAPGSRFAVYTAGDDGWRTAADLIACGCEVTAVIDPRPQVAQALSDPIASAGIRVMLGAQVVGTRGVHALKTIDVRDERGSIARIEADALAMSNGWDPLIGPFFDRGVMLMDFEEHRHHRRIMQQAFKRERLVAYLDKMNPAIARGIARWRPEPGFELYRATKQLTLDIATEVFVGGELGAKADRLNRAFIDCVVGGQALIRADVPGGK